MRRWILLAALVFALPARAVVEISWVPVGDAGNLPDDATNCYAANCGSVPYEYWISKYEVTNAQYVEFLNAKAASDPLGLYSLTMNTYGPVGITRAGVPGSYTYALKPGSADMPVLAISFYDAARFANWLSNGQGDADTEMGAYTLLGGTAVPSNGPTVTRNAGAIIYIPSENEWYKAAYYSPGGVYFDYPAGTDEPIICSGPREWPNVASCNFSFYTTTKVSPVGWFFNAPSPYDTFDQGGNVLEWIDGFFVYQGVPSGILRGGHWSSTRDSLFARYSRQGSSRASEHGATGIRLVTLVAPLYCADGLDNDGDGFLDADDPGCDDAADLDEHSAALACDDGADNDGDDGVDFRAIGGGGDVGCASPASLTETSQCQDGLNNDFQIGIDFDGGASVNDGVPFDEPDADCVGRPWWDREVRPCGIGAELALVMPLLGLVASRRRRGSRTVP